MPDIDIIGYGSKHSHEFKLYLNEWSTDAGKNTSTVGFELSLYKSSYSWYGATNITWSLTINGTSYSGSIPDYSAGGRLSLINSYLEVPHDADGTKTLSAYFSVYDGSGRSYTCGNASASGNLTLTAIPQGTYMWISERSKSWDRIEIDWSAGKPSSYVQYSINGGAWEWANKYSAYESPDHLSGHFEIQELSPDTTYSIRGKCARIDTSVYSESGTLSVRTNSANITITSNDIDYGEDLGIILTNPSDLSTTVVGTINNTEIINQSISTGLNVITFTDAQLTEIFKQYGDISQDNTVTMTLTATASNGSTSTTNLVITFTGDRATVWVYDSEWKKGIVWAKDNGTWKKGIAWKGENGTWKKAL